MDLATADHLLTTTRSVRKRLDFAKPVDLAVVGRCSRSRSRRRPDRTRRAGASSSSPMPTSAAALADLYRKAFELYASNPDMRPTFGDDDLRTKQLPRVVDSAMYLAEHMHEAPVLVIPCIEGRDRERRRAGAGVGLRLDPAGGVVVHARAAHARARLGVDHAPPHVRAGRGEAPRHPGARDPDRALPGGATTRAPTSSPPSASRRRSSCTGTRGGRTGPDVSVRFELPPDHPHVAVVTIDRPEAANALDPPTLRDLAAAWRRIAGDAGHPLRRPHRRRRARLLRRHGHEDDHPGGAAPRARRAPRRRDVRRAARRRDRHPRRLRARRAAGVRDQRPRARRWLRPDARVRRPLRRARRRPSRSRRSRSGSIRPGTRRSSCPGRSPGYTPRRCC